MTVCKKCGSVDFYFESLTIADGRIQIKQYCVDCNSFVKFAKQSNETKSKDEYRKEYMENQEATSNQISYIQNIIKYKGDIRNRLQASELISNYKNKK